VWLTLPFCTIRWSPRSPLLPYTTLCRSRRIPHRLVELEVGRGAGGVVGVRQGAVAGQQPLQPRQVGHAVGPRRLPRGLRLQQDAERKSTRLNSSHVNISYAVCCWIKEKR